MIRSTILLLARCPFFSYTAYLPTGENGHVLLTTRDPSVQSLVQGIEVEQLNVQEGSDLLLHRAYGLAAHVPMQQVSQDELNIAAQIVKEMDGHPLAIDGANGTSRKSLPVLI